MRAFRNMLVHEYGRIDDRYVYEMVKNKLSDFQAFKQEILEGISRRSCPRAQYIKSQIILQSSLLITVFKTFLSGRKLSS
jgi:hypothetical protein